MNQFSLSLFCPFENWWIILILLICSTGLSFEKRNWPRFLLLFKRTNKFKFNFPISTINVFTSEIFQRFISVYFFLDKIPGLNPTILIFSFHFHRHHLLLLMFIRNEGGCCWISIKLGSTTISILVDIFVWLAMLLMTIEIDRPPYTFTI